MSSLLAVMAAHQQATLQLWQQRNDRQAATWQKLKIGVLAGDDVLSILKKSLKNKLYKNLETVVTLPHIGKNQQNNVDRYYRVALEELKEYREIENRKTHIWTSNKVSAELKTILVLLNAKRIPEAKAHLDTLFQILAGIAEDSWNSA